MIVADTSAVLALLDRSARHHRALRRAFERHPEEWVLPWAILPELDYMAARMLGAEVADALREDLAEGRLAVEWGDPADLARALELDRSHAALALGLVDGVVMAIAERLGARAIVTLDERDFGAVTLAGQPALWPRDL